MPGRITGSKNIAEGLTREEFARQTGLSKANVAKLCSLGILPLIPDPSKRRFLWKIDPKALEDAKNKVLADVAEDEKPADILPDGSTAPKVAESKGVVADFWAAKAKKEAMAADLAEIKLREAQGTLIDRDDTESALFSMARTTRDRCLAVADRLAPLVVGVQNERQIRDVIRREITSALEGLSEDFDSVASLAIVDE